MPQLRRDPIIGRWVIVATERARRPGNFIGSDENDVACEASPFICGSESETLPEIFAIRDEDSQPNSPGWKVRVIPNRTPLLDIEGELKRHGHGLYDVMKAVGAHEVVIESPQPIPNMADLDVGQIELVFNTFVSRVCDLQKDPRFKYVMIFKNHRSTAGADAIPHTRSQIIATPFTPGLIKEKLIGAKRYFDYHERCIYCDLIRQESEARERIVSENDEFAAVTPFASRFPFETWIIPKKHCCDFAKGIVGLEASLAAMLKEILLKIKLGLNDAAYNCIIHSAPFRRENAQQGKFKTIEDDFHWHIEIIPRLTYVAGFEKGTGFYICSIPPEYTAEFLRKVEI